MPCLSTPIKMYNFYPRLRLIYLQWDNIIWILLVCLECQSSQEDKYSISLDTIAQIIYHNLQDSMQPLGDI